LIDHQATKIQDQTLKVSKVLVPEPVLLDDSENIGLLSLEMNTTLNIISDQPKQADISLVYPYGDYTPRALLIRPFEYDTETITTSWTGVIWQFSPSFFSSAFPDMARFTYGRYGVRFRFVISSTATHQGSIMFGYLPFSDDLNTSHIRAGYLSMCNSSIMTIGGETDMEYVVPYVAPAEGYKLDSTRPAFTLCALPLTPFRPNGATSTIPMRVFISLVDPVTWGFQRKPPIAFEKQSGKEKRNKERDFTSKTLVTKASNVIKTLPYVGEPWRNIANFINDTEFSKPQDTRFPSPMVIKKFAGLSNCDSMSLSESLCPQSSSLLDPTDEKFADSSMTLGTLMSHPSLFQQITFTTTPTPYLIKFNPAFYDLVNSSGGINFPSGDFLSHSVQAHTYWRGSVKVSIYFTTNAYTSARFLLKMWTGGSGSNISDLLSVIIDVKGDTWYNVTLPYISNVAWTVTPSNAGFDSGDGMTVAASIECLNISSPTTTVTPYVDAALFRCAGPDFQVALPKIPISNLDSRGTMRTGFRKECDSLNKHFTQTKFKPFIDACIDSCGNKSKPRLAVECRRSNPECPMKVIDYMRRADYIPTFAMTSPVMDGGEPEGQRRIQYYWGSLFLYYRGSMVVTEIPGNTSTYSGHFGQITIPTATAIIYSRHSPTTLPDELEGTGQIGRTTIPYYSTHPFYFSKPQTIVSPVSAATLPGNGLGLLQYGDDYQGMFLMPPLIKPLTLAA